ncbi:MAG: ankyrin repeat domain-containing protein [Gemmataceae bacterium]
MGEKLRIHAVRQFESLDQIRAWLRGAPEWARFVWHAPNPHFPEYECHNTILHLVVAGMYNNPNDLELAALLLEYGADPNANNDNGWTPLHYACKFDSRDLAMVELLLRHGADPNARDNQDLHSEKARIGNRSAGGAHDKRAGYLV